MIAILKAFHGIPEDRPVQPRSPYAEEDTPRCTPNPGHASTNCSYCANDCIDDSMNLVYDWSTCMGNSSCERTVMQSYIPSCKEDDKFSHYLQTQYQCVPRKDREMGTQGHSKVTEGSHRGYIGVTESLQDCSKYN